MEELRPETKQRTSKAAPWFRNTETQIKGSTSFDFKGLGRDREKGYMLRKFEVSIFVGLCVNLSNSQLWMFYTPSSHRDCLCVLPAKCVTVCSSVVFNQKDCLQYDPDTHQHAHFLPNLSKFECWKLQFFFWETNATSWKTAVAGKISINLIPLKPAIQLPEKTDGMKSYVFQGLTNRIHHRPRFLAKVSKHRRSMRCKLSVRRAPGTTSGICWRILHGIHTLFVENTWCERKIVV